MQLRGQGRRAGVLVEARQEGIVFHHLQHDVGIQGLGQAPGQRGLAHADGTLHHDVIGQVPAHSAVILATPERSTLPSSSRS